MNAKTDNRRNDRRNDTNREAASNVTPIRHAAYRERDFGVGYGNSSGYASGKRRYVTPTDMPLFRCA
jgi:hypothetical protein